MFVCISALENNCKFRAKVKYLLKNKAARVFKKQVICLQHFTLAIFF